MARVKKIKLDTIKDYRDTIKTLKETLHDLENRYAKRICPYKIGDVLAINDQLYAVSDIQRWPLYDYRVLVKKITDGLPSGRAIILEEIN